VPDSITATTDNRHAQSVTPVVTKLPPDAACSLKRHFRNALREVVGYLDLLAKKDPERFVYPKVSAIVAACKKYDQVDETGKRIIYSRRIVESALEYLRAMLYICGPVKRWRGHALRKGYIVVPHDALTRRAGANCFMVGWRIDRNPTTPGSWKTEPSNGMVYWTAGDCSARCAVNCAEHCADKNSNCAEHCADETQKLCGELCGELCGTDPPQTVDSSANTTLGDEKCASTCAELAPPNRGSRVQSAVVSVLPVVSVLEQSSSQVGTGETKNQKPGGEAGEVEKQPLIEQTIGQHFGPEPYSMVPLARISDGVLVTDTSQWDFETERQMQECCGEVIRKMAAETYNRERTAANSHAQIMWAAGKLFNKTHGKKYPSSWLRVLNELRGTSTAG
jgi:hypothetical protein